MSMSNYSSWLRCLLLPVCIFFANSIFAQTDIDAIMMGKNSFCSGFIYNNSSWKNYWEGTDKRDNQNLGKVSTKSVSFVANYGITKKLNVLAGLPYVTTKASAGTLHGLKGLQDASLWLKYQPIKRKVGKGILSLYTIGGFSFPVSDYVADFLPLSIGMHSKNLSLRGLLDYQYRKLFATASYTYVVRSNIKIDRPSYYTTTMHNTNEVFIPNASQVNVRVGYRSSRLIGEAVFNKWTTLGGFDISKNNMPFPGNRMNATMAGVNFKYNLTKVESFSITGGANYVLAGRNVGQATSVYGGLLLLLDFSSSPKFKAPVTSK